jgi:hypothetical protein
MRGSNLRGAEDRNRTGTEISLRRILSPLRLPVPPPRHKYAKLLKAVNKYLIGGGTQI